jgi:hypothetical protein
VILIPYFISSRIFLLIEISATKQSFYMPL